MLRRACGPTLFITALSSLCPAQDTHGFVLEAGEHAIEDLVDRAARYLNRTYLLDITKTRRKGIPAPVVLQKGMELDAIGCEEVVSQLLFAQGWVMTPLDEVRGVYEWLPIENDRNKDIFARAFAMTPEELYRRRGLKVCVMVTMPMPSPEAAQVLVGYVQTVGNNQIRWLPGRETVTFLGMSDAVVRAVHLVRGLEAVQQKKKAPGEQPKKSDQEASQ